MPTLTIQGWQVQVGDDFLKLSPEQQNSTVEEIAKSLPGVKPPAPETKGAPFSSTVAGPSMPEEADGGFLGRLWHGLSGGDVSRAGRIGMGMADPAVGIGQFAGKAGAAQLGAEAAIGGAGTDLKLPEPLAKGGEAIDKAVQEREQRYQAGRKAAGDKPGGFLDDIWRIVGNVASPVTLATGAPMGAAMRGAGLGGRLAASTIGGAAQAFEQPELTSKPGQIGIEKLTQPLEGAVGGLAGGAVGEAVTSALASSLARGSAQEADRLLTTAFRRTIMPRTRGTTESQIQKQDRNIVTAVDEIVRRRQARGLQGDALPVKNFDEFVSELSNSRTAVFDEYHGQLVQATAEEMSHPNPHMVDRFRQTGAAVQQAGNAVRDAQNALTMTSAATQRAGNNVYMSAIALPGQRQAAQQLQQATVRLRQAEAAHNAIKERMYQPYIDLAPVAQTLRTEINNVLRTYAPDVVNRLNGQINRLLKQGSFTLPETEKTIAMLNSRLGNWYRSGNPAGASMAKFEAEQAGLLRRTLDQTIENLKGPGYQDLKLRYGALRDVEKDVVSAYQKEARKVPGGVGGILADAMAVMHGIGGILTLDAQKLATAVGDLAAKKFIQRQRDPNIAIAQMFKRRAEGITAPPMSPAAEAILRGVRSPTARAAGPTAGAALSYSYGRELPPSPIRRRTPHETTPPPSVR